ncbi:PaaI family thioesterase [Xinfangfangia sp. D13-10-4-6]|uniref:PaaI family thioesterase n=1 Tax=Pseudogemmobacter hezensis TaxID=2737662 RepID=UPI001555D8F7|nr:PaaI family thioesterase [Pseudogemmobacter hezensis]NPD17127.1 PaaI family thioesterase [Pseudogemmobacter hezensis]
MSQPLPTALEISPFAALLGLEITAIAPDRVEADLVVRPELLNRNGVLHGGAIMALADSLGGAGTFASIPADQTTTTVESKTNFFRPLAAGQRVHAVCLPLQKGRRLQVWQTSILREDGKLAAQVTQTQMVLPR